MKLRLFAKEDYGIISEWWEARNLPAIPFHGLPPIGWVAYENSKDCACAWLDTSMHGYMTYLWAFVSNPEAGGFKVKAAHDAILDCAEKFAKSEGYQIMIAMPYQQSIAKLLGNKGFHTNHESVAQMFKVIGGAE